MNWGYKLMFTFIAFGIMIGYLVFRSLNTRFELVEKDYYKNELAYQQVIDGNKMAGTLHSAVKVEQSGSGIRIQFPEEITNKPVSGTAWFYCDYDQQKDKKLVLHPGPGGLQLIDNSYLSPGHYLVKISWDCDGKNYYSESTLRVK